MATNTYRIEIVGSSLLIYINDVLHIGLRQEDFKGLQSWKMAKGWYCIMLYMVSDKVKWNITLEYDNPAKSNEILKLLTPFV